MSRGRGGPAPAHARSQHWLGVAVLVAATACDAGAPEQPPELKRIDVRPPVVGPSVVLKAEGPAQQLGGVSVRFAYATHTMGKTTRAYATFELGTRPIELSGLEGGDQAEVVEQGALFVFERLGYEQYRVTLAGTNVAAYPDLDDEDNDEYVRSDCDARIRVLAHGAGLHHGSWRSRGIRNGFATLRDEQWVGHCGLYTMRVWLTARTDERRD